ncbi:MAG: Accessory colonization factor AcfD [uncultured Sulfurovum sp.]|uniref:Accessory colonization factor AcfD n=1 Tax=uncultured Sulfurovum sp. TaxID=269237 RepID=A0A6S6TYT6_9BACT|nr:MAG: Accessory colonization factor AcfD [uncultured Sulfurovum sp.]
MNNLLKLSLLTTLVSTLSIAIPSVDSADTSSLKSTSVASDVDAQLEKIYDGVREFHIFKVNYGQWSGTDTFTTLVTGQNGFPVFSARNDKDPKYVDYPIKYESNSIQRYIPVRPPSSVKDYYPNNSIELGNENTSTYNAPMVAAGTIGKGRVLVMGSHLYASILVRPRNYSNNVRNHNSVNEIVDSSDMENFFHNTFTWLTEQNTNENNRYSQNGSAIPILSNKTRTVFWGISSAGINNDLKTFTIHDNFNLTSDAKPKVTTTWKEANDNGLLDPSKYPLIILEDFEMTNTWSDFFEHTVRKTALSEVDLIVDYIRAGGGVLMMESPRFRDKHNIQVTASNEILKKAGISNFFANNAQETKLLPSKNEVGGVHQFDMCLLDYIGHTDLQRRLGLNDYSTVPTDLDGLKSMLNGNGKLSYLEEVLKRRVRQIFLEGNETKTLNSSDCGHVEVDLADGNKTAMQTILVKGDGIIQDDNNYDKYAKYPVDLNFVQAQGDVGGSMNSLLSHELGTTQLSSTDVNREYTNMSALLLNDATFSGEKFESLNQLLNEYKVGGRFVNANGEFYPGFSFTKKDVLDFRRKPVTRIMVERAFYDKNLKYDPSEFPGQSTANGSAKTAKIYLKRNTTHQQWYAGNMQSTGLYAPAHQDVTITLPENVNANKMQLLIGVGDNVGGIFRHEINLKRPPKYVKKYKFTQGNTLTVQHPYGGLIFLKSFENAVADNASAEVSFTGVQSAIHFVLGETTSEAWESMKTALAPKAELESKHYILTVPRANMASLTFEEVTNIAQGYDEMSKNAYDFYGYDQTCADTFNEHTPPSCNNDKKLAHKNREVFDPHISVGAGHSGYPIMVMKWKPASTKFPQDPRNSFLLWHEMGHNMVESWLGIAGATEVANNVMAGHQQKRFSLAERSFSTVNLVLNKQQPWADGGNAGRLMMFNQLIGWINTNYMDEFKTKNSKYYENGNPKVDYPFLDGDGYDIYKILHREARDKTATSDKYDVCMKQTGKTKTDMLAICSSAILELDTSTWLATWKAGVVGIGAVDGVNIYNTDGGLSNNVDTGYSNAPSPSIEGYTGN